jgi:hypothetical protein
MVTIVYVAERESSKDGKKFFSLVLQRGMELVLSEESGRYYATAKRASITSTFDEANAKSLIGKKLPGKITKIQCDPYDFILKETGEVLKLTHRWVFDPNESSSLEEVVYEKEPIGVASEF